jgi:hypothetical protein
LLAPLAGALGTTTGTTTTATATRGGGFLPLFFALAFVVLPAYMHTYHVSKQAGNSVTVELISLLAGLIKESLSQS